jgi:hypothetical protein
MSSLKLEQLFRHRQRLFSKKNMVYYRTHTAVHYNSLYLIVNSFLSYPPDYKGKGVEWGTSLLLVEPFVYVC